MRKRIIASFIGLFMIGATLFGLNAMSPTTNAASPRDCDNNSILYCGALTQSELISKYDKNTQDVKAVYNYFGISRSDLTGSSSQMLMGRMYKNGNIVVDGKTVATGAYSIGRQNSGGSTKVTINGKTYYKRSDARNFLSEYITAYVYFRNGQFYRAVLTSCGNPVKATPKPKPEYSCNTLGVDKISRTEIKFTASASVKNGAAIKSYHFDFGDGKSVNSTSKTVSHTYAKAGTYNTKVTVSFSIPGKTVTDTSANCAKKVTIETPPAQPVYTCDTLTAKMISRTEASFTAKATALNGAKISKYVFTFGDGKTATSTSATVSHTYAAPGTYNSKVTAYFTVNGATKTATSAKCEAKVTVAPAPVTPTYTCNSLTQSKINRTDFKFTASASAANGAKITNYIYDFGDGKSQTTTDTNVTHSYATPGTYTAKLTVLVKINNVKVVFVTSPKCATTITVEKAPVTPTYACTDLVASPISKYEYKFTTTASADGGAKIVRYNYTFGDSTTGTATTNTINHTYAKAGTYTAKATVIVLVNGKEVPVTAPACETTLTITVTPPVANYTCDSLVARLINKEDRSYGFDLKYTANNVTLTGVDFNFGDGSTQMNVQKADLANVTHSYGQDGSYTATTALHFTKSDGSVVSASCQVVINISPEACAINPSLPKDSPDCAPCEVPGKDQYPKGSPECVETPVTPETPTELPSTGPEAAIGGLFGSSALGYGIYNFAASRRAIRNSLKK